MPGIKQNQSAFQALRKLSGSSILESVKVYPESVSFEGQDETEQIVLFLRQHPLVLVPVVFRSIIILVFTGVTAFFGTQVLSGLGIGPVAIDLVVLTLGGMIAISNLLLGFFKWFFNAWIITSTRIVDIDFVDLFNAQMSTTMLRVVQDVGHKTPGFIAPLFDIGNIHIQTAAEVQDFEISMVPKPREVQDIIMDLVESTKTDDESI